MRAQSATVRARADRARRRRRAQRLPHQALHLVGRRVLRLDGREHAHDRLHRRGHRGDRRRRSTSTQATTTLLIGAVVWAYLGIIFEFLTETVAWERWEGTIEYTFMAPLSRAMHLGGMGVFAVALRPRPRDRSSSSSSRSFFGLAMPRRELRRRARRPRRRVDLVHRDRDDDGGPAADLAGEGRAARLRRAGDCCSSSRASTTRSTVLPRVDAVDLEDLAGDVRAATGSATRSSTAPG